MRREVNFDGLIGPTHHYGGLGKGNLASQTNRAAVAHPRAAALQGLSKMKLLMDLGFPQAVLPFHPRPHLQFLRDHGFTGSDQRMIEQAALQRPDLLSIAYSASAMWAANAATVSPSSDTADNRVHFTPANLISNPHRLLEASETTRIFRKIFSNERFFHVHDPLPPEDQFADEGAANHTLLSAPMSSQTHTGIEIFTYGRDTRFPVQTTQHHPRQTLQASQRIVQQHGLDPDRVLFVQQHPAAIDAGVFHNDVIAVGHENLLLLHERAYDHQSEFVQQLKVAYHQTVLESRPAELIIHQVPEHALSLQEAVETYFFNSQIITRDNSSRCLISPSECQINEKSQAVIQQLLIEKFVDEVKFVDVRQSMRNGGGPACLRLRVQLTEQELEAIPKSILLNETLYQQLLEFVKRYYREELSIEDLADPQLLKESSEASQALNELIQLS